MNRNHAATLEDEMRDFDRLVDGELAPAAQRELLSRIDAASTVAADDPWRQLALAYVENHAWQSDFTAIRAEKPAPTRAPLAPTRGSSAGLVKALLAVAASALIAFGLGMAVRGELDGSPSDDRLVEDQQPGVAPTLVGQPADVGNFRLPIFVKSEGGAFDGGPQRPVTPFHLKNALEDIGMPGGNGPDLVPVQLGDGEELLIPADELERHLDAAAEEIKLLQVKLQERRAAGDE